MSLSQHQTVESKIIAGSRAFILRMAPKTILVTGGCGYIGSHTISCLLEKDYNVVVVDNLVNSSPKSLDRVCEIVGLNEEQRKERLVVHEVDLCNESDIRKVFQESPTFTSCIHFAGLKVSISFYF